MPPTNPLIITVKVTGAGKNDYVIITNLTRSGRDVIKLIGGTANTEKGGNYRGGDIINATLQGRLQGSAQITLSTADGGDTINITGAADTNSVAVDL